jgi:hypothetical protein
MFLAVNSLPKTQAFHCCNQWNFIHILSTDFSFLSANIPTNSLMLLIFICYNGGSFIATAFIWLSQLESILIYTLPRNTIGKGTLYGRNRSLISFTKLFSIQLLPFLFKCSILSVRNLKNLTWLKINLRLYSLLLKSFTSLFTHEKKVNHIYGGS